MGEGLRRLRREAEVGEAVAERGEVDQERDAQYDWGHSDAHRRAAVRAEQRIDLVDLADEPRAPRRLGPQPGEPALAILGVAGILEIGDRTGCGAWLAQLR